MPKVQVQVVGKSRVISGYFVGDSIPSQKTLNVERSTLDKMTLEDFMNVLENSTYEHLEYVPTATLLKTHPCIVYYSNPHSRWLGCKVSFDGNTGAWSKALRVQGIVIEQFKVHSLPSTTLKGKKAVFKSWPTTSYVRVVVNEKEDEKTINRDMITGHNNLAIINRKYLHYQTQDAEWPKDPHIRPVLFVDSQASTEKENVRSYYETTIEARYINSRNKDINLVELAVSGIPELVNLARNPRVLSRQ